MLVRRLARTLFASWFVAEGWQAVRGPEPHVARVKATWVQLADRLELPAPPDDSTLTLAVRLHGGALAAAAALLALGRAPRTAALVLAGLTAPLVVADASALRGGSPADRDRFVRALSMLGGALLAGIDHEGRPSMGWRIEHATINRRVAREAQHAVSTARREAGHAAATARRGAGHAASTARREAGHAAATASRRAHAAAKAAAATGHGLAAAVR